MSTPNLTFYIVDVFAETKYAGNQLAVIRGASGLSTEEMQTIALEMYYSETTFILQDEMKNGGYDMRIFTSETELPTAGHPSLGTAYIINHKILPETTHKLTLNQNAGQIPITFADDGVIWMRQAQPQFTTTFDASDFADIVGVSPDDIDTQHPAQIVSTGVPFTFVPLKSLNAVRHVKVDWAKFNALVDPHVRGAALNGLMVFSPETYDAGNDINARVLFDVITMPEDPATGSANGAFTGYLVKNQYFGEAQVNARVEQGYEIKRPSLLMLKGHASDDGIEVNVGGRVQMVAEGELIR